MYGKRVCQMDVAGTGLIARALAECGIDSMDTFMFFCQRICYLVSFGIEALGHYQQRVHLVSRNIQALLYHG